MQEVIGFDADVNETLSTCGRGDYVYGCISRIHFKSGKLSAVLTFIERLEITVEEGFILPPTTGTFTLWVSIAPKETTPSTYSFVGKRTVYASKDLPAAPLTVQVDVPIVKKLGTKRLEPIKSNVGISVQVIVTGMEKCCLSGDLLEYTLTDKLERPNDKPKITPRRPRAPILEHGDDGAKATPSKKQKK